MAVEQYSVVAKDWINLESIINDLTQRVIGQELHPTSEPTFGAGTVTGNLSIGGNLDLTGSLTLDGLTASRLVATDAGKALESSDLVNWVAGTADEINVTDDGDGSITIGIADPLIVTKGGTGAPSLTDGGIVLGSGTDPVTVLAQATNGQLPIGSTGADPVLAALTGTANQVVVTNGAGTITLSTPQDIHTGASVTFANVTDSALTQNRVVLAGASGILSDSANLTFGGGTLAVTGLSNLGDGGTTTYLSVEADGDTFWVGDSTGIPYGHMYTNTTIAVTLTDQNTWYEIDGTQAWTTGLTNLCTFTDPEISVDKAGVYEITWTLSTDFSASPGAAQEIEYGIMVNGTIQNEGQAHRTLANSTDTGHCSGVAILDLAADDDVSLAARNVSSAGKILHVEHGNMTVKMLGGT
jgi:hypothetical protein